MYIKQGRDRPTDSKATIVVLIREEHMILFWGSNSWFRDGETILRLNIHFCAQIASRN